MRQKHSNKLEKLFSKAIHNHQTGNIKDAEKIYNKIIKINSKIDVVHNNLGMIYLKSNKKKLAQSQEEKVNSTLSNNVSDLLGGNKNQNTCPKRSP